MKPKKTAVGITLVELILTIGIISVLSAATAPMGIGFLQRNQVRETRDVLVSYLNTARNFSMNAKNGTRWGVNTSEHITLFSGDSYAERDTSLDVRHTPPPTITVQEAEVIFTKHTGETDQTSISITGYEGQGFSIIVDSKGNLNIE